MSDTNKRGTWMLVGTLWALGSGIPAFADDTELFVSDSGAFSGVIQPNILFIIDTSGSMDGDVDSQGPYDPTETYTGDCSASRVYWIRITGNPNIEPPDCNTNNWFDADQLLCDRAVKAFALGARGRTDLFAQYDDNSDDRWEYLDANQKSRQVECEDDSGVHGDGISSTKLWASDDQAGEPWIADSSKGVPWGSNLTNRRYTVYDANYLNWYFGAVTTSTRLEVVQDVTTSLLAGLTGVNVGLMRFNEREGGPVVHAMEDIATATLSSNPNNIIDKINAFTPDGWTPLSETLYEAGQYYAGRSVDYGDDNGTQHGDIWSVAESRTGGVMSSTVYDSPIEYSCQKNFVVLLTDGEPTQDTDANNTIKALPDYTTLVGAKCDPAGQGACLDDMAEYLFAADLDDILVNQQNVVTYTIGFTVDLPILASTAKRGGGEYYLADDTATLATALTDIVTSILEFKTSFTAPAVTVNSFNRTQNANDLYISLFEAQGDVHWPGNLKKYRLRASDGEIMDANGNVAVDPATGFFADTAQSYWSAGVDGPETVLGGAANLIPDPAARNVYTYLFDSDLTAASNNMVGTNALIDDNLLSIGQVGDPLRDDLIDFIRGLDVTDTDSDGIVAEPRYQMGDPLHAKSISIAYGGTVGSPDQNDAVVFFATNDGYLHAIDPETGVEKWTFIPPEFLADQVLLYWNGGSAGKHYGIDGSLTVQLLDVADDGIVDPGAGDKVYLYFGMRRGGTAYYGLDVTYQDSPKLMWTLDSASLPGSGQSWSTPMSSRIDIFGAVQNAEKAVLVFGGGYDATQDNYAGATDTQGNAIYIVDSVSGTLLWHASDSGSDRNLSKMEYSIPSDVRVIDINSNGFADRMYVADMGGQVWRFDIANGDPASSLITGGVIAQLGGAPQDPSADADSRRFYYAPDIALVNDDSNNFLHIGIGSGHRAHPNSELTQDHFYALRDYAVFNSRTQTDYDAVTPTTAADLVDITDDINAVVPPGSPGWRFELRDGGWTGEKVLAEARTFDNAIYFTTFTPGAGASTSDCLPVLGINRLYVVDIFNGAPVNNLDEVGDDYNLTETDRYKEFKGSIASEVVFVFPSPDDPDTCVGEECTPEPLACVGLFCFSPGFANDPQRTFWSEESVQ